MTCKIYTAQECPQGSDIWWELKKGKPSASNFHRIVTSKGKPSAGMDGYIAELIADEVMMLPKYFTERGRPVTKAMTEGTDREPEARRYYELEHDCRVEQVGLCVHASGLFCCSPDGLVGEDGGLELKNPKQETQAKWLMKGVVPREHIAQCHGFLLVTGRKWIDFYSYADGLRPLEVRVTPNEFTEQLQSALTTFLDKFAAAKAKLIGREPGCEP